MARSSGDAAPDQINMVGEGTVFEGTLRAESNVRVSGHIKGKLDVKGRAIVTQEGVVEGELHATDADVAGSVQGEIHVAERLMLKSSARIDGNITSGRIKVEEGALFSGQCDIGEQVNDQVQKQIGEKGARDTGSSSGSSGEGGASPDSNSSRASGSSSAATRGDSDSSSSGSSSRGSSSSKTKPGSESGSASDGKSSKKSAAGRSGDRGAAKR